MLLIHTYLMWDTKELGRSNITAPVVLSPEVLGRDHKLCI